eukprot:TRINITY_DN3273_c0_g2_i6.p1 TRINITY_DN3273_c0_g2~~TRINITY_DN3273_c0_g2_i6.p1  ORF type:complete len:162 (-),score=70.66 TRINITY_DN3273_c0_g2_i6:138-554(-)
MVDVSDPAIAETYAEIRKAAVGTTWMTIEYEPSGKKVKLSAKGTGGIDEVLATLPEDQARYGYVRFEHALPGDPTKRTKFLFFSWAPGGMKPMLKGKISVHLPNVKEVIKDASITIQAGVKEELSEEVIKAKIAKANY